MDKLEDIYYQPNHLWKGQKAIKKLQELSKEEQAVIKKWLSWQAIWQVQSPVRCISLVCCTCPVIRYMEISTSMWNLWNRCGFDVASRYKVARTKQAADIATMIANIYKVGPHTYPKIFQCENGSEFKGEVTRML